MDFIVHYLNTMSMCVGFLKGDMITSSSNKRNKSMMCRRYVMIRDILRNIIMNVRMKCISYKIFKVSRGNIDSSGLSKGYRINKFSIIMS